MPVRKAIRLRKAGMFNPGGSSPFMSDNNVFPTKPMPLREKAPAGGSGMKTPKPQKPGGKFSFKPWGKGKPEAQGFGVAKSVRLRKASKITITVTPDDEDQTEMQMPPEAAQGAMPPPQGGPGMQMSYDRAAKSQLRLAQEALYRDVQGLEAMIGLTK